MRKELRDIAKRLEQRGVYCDAVEMRSKHMRVVWRHGDKTYVQHHSYGKFDMGNPRGWKNKMSDILRGLGLR